MARTVTLVRLKEFAHSTPGIIYINDAPTFLTLEPPWLDNARNISCIPLGVYRCKRIDSYHYGSTFEVTNVPGRSDILFHWGNTPEDTEGCIMIGDSWGWIDPYFAVLNSQKTFKRFRQIFEGSDSFEMKITEAQYD